MSVIRECMLDNEQYQSFPTGGYVPRVLDVYSDISDQMFVVYEFSDDGPSWLTTLHLCAVNVGGQVPNGEYQFIRAVTSEYGVTLWYARRELRRAGAW